MKASTRLVLQTLFIAGMSVGLGLAFNNARHDSLPLVQTREKPAPVAVAAGEAPIPTQIPAAEANASAPETAPEASVDVAGLNATAGEPAALQPAENASAQESGPDAGSVAANATDAPEGVIPAENASEERSAGVVEAIAPVGEEISIQDAARLFSARQAVFVDARDAELYAEGHVQGAVSLPLHSFGQDFPALRDRLQGMTVITYCDGERCTLSADLAEQLRAHGVENVRELRNGWTLWQEQGLPTATGRNTEHGGGQS
jgi:rhodanese-related sulfurtransferase